MDVTLFQKEAFGSLIPVSGSTPAGVPWQHFAFLPRSLGDRSPELDSSCYRTVAEARASLAALDATANRLPNPKMFRTASLRLEAQATAALEGTYEPLERVLAADDDDTTDTDLREVLNYLGVAHQAFAWSEQGRGWGVRDLLELQAMLVKGTASEREFSGQVRPIQVVIGRRESASPGDLPIKAARYVPPPPGQDLESRLRDVSDWMQADHSAAIDPVVAAAMGHYAFEATHPFHDGNGRIGRLLIVLQLLASGTLTEPTLTVSPWFEARRAEYYDALFGVSSRSDWSTWVTFFARGLGESADATRLRMLALAAVQADLKERLQATPIRTANARILVDYAVGHATFTVGQAAMALGMSHAGTKKLVDSMVAHQLLAPWGERNYNRQFHAPEVMRTLTQR